MHHHHGVAAVERRDEVEVAVQSLCDVGRAADANARAGFPRTSWRVSSAPARVAMRSSGGVSFWVKKITPPWTSTPLGA